MAGISNEGLRLGIEAARDHKGYFDLGTFRAYCRKPVGAAPSFEQTQPKLAQLDKLGKNPKTRDLLKVTQAMMAEDGNGPITEATKLGLLTSHFVRNKTSDEIIEYCMKRKVI